MKDIKDFLIFERRDISSYPAIYQKIYSALSNLLNEELSINLDVEKINSDEGPISLGQFKDTAIERSMGHILESYILAYLREYEDPASSDQFIIKQTNNDIYDADITLHTNGEDINSGIEVKAYTKKTYNINFTDNQRKHLNDKDIIYVFVKYSNTESKIKIEKILVGTYDDVSNGKSTISRHGKTGNMASVKNK